MQRSITNKKSIAPLIYIVLFAIYESLSSIYLFLPPLLGVLFVLFVDALEREDTVSVMVVSFCLVLFEADKGYILFTSIIYFILVYKFIMPRLIQSTSCYSCIKISYVVLAYLGFFVFNYILSKIFLSPMPTMSYYIIYYIIIEFLIVSIL